VPMRMSWWLMTDMFGLKYELRRLMNGWLPKLNQPQRHQDTKEH
jgi:hypothetical protein